jgi:hypothetical protein
MMSNTQGGVREGAGRKKLDYPFKIIQVRVPLEMEGAVKDFIKKLRNEWLTANTQ